MQRLPDDLVRDMRAIEITGIDMVDASFDSSSQHSNSDFAVPRRSEYTRASKLHRPISHTVHDAVAE